MQKTMSLKGGFTLMELLVVISIISMLASVVLASTQSVQAKGRDAKRTEQIHQIDLAVQLYKANHGENSPDLQGGCAALQSGAPTASQASACFAVSTAAAGSDQANAWHAFASDIAPYMPRVPNDPCPSCSSPLGLPLGYAYVAPRSLQYTVIQGGGAGCPSGASQLNQQYQMFATFESKAAQTGTASCGPFSNPLSSITVLSPNGGETWYDGESHNVTWNYSNITSDYVVHPMLYSSDGSSFVCDINPTTPITQGNVSFSIAIGSCPPALGNYRIRLDAFVLSSGGSQTFSDLSNAPFAISAPPK